VRPFVVHQIDPGYAAYQDLFAKIRRGEDRDYALAVPEISVCRIDGSYVNDCDVYIGAVSGALVPSQVAQLIALILEPH
jgi:hypothetical protein